MSTDNARRGGTHENGITARPPLTPKQRTVLVAVIELMLDRNGIAPTWREIQTRTGHASMASISSHMHALVRKGYLEHEKHTGRGVQVVGARWVPPAIDDLRITPNRPFIHAHDADERCKTCGRREIHGNGECSRCYAYRRRNGKTRPRNLIRADAPFGWCECGQGADVLIMTAHGEMPLCRSCARLELDPTL